MSLSFVARYFVTTHGHRLDVAPFDRERWRAANVSESVIDRAAEHHGRWGGLVLPPSLAYDGGPRCFAADLPTGADGADRFDAGHSRSALPYTFDIGPDGEFGLGCGRFVALHESVEGWIESLAFAHYAAIEAQKITKVREVDLDGFEPVEEVRGVADTWWRAGTTFVSIHGGLAEYYDQPEGRYARVHEGVGGLLSPRASRS
ncbi:hypothetical protein [Lentzea sp. NBRC 102530]|uniref:hypothetical protein n=1 Tax=Lentzea sp. NBRC 102530 TaxID=3032201 RepID=UPI0024A1A0FE|nr:hypothetical protein [Lentzea sp. NBRC 102530]GLY55116.1 hypothetical protein Lesp01_87710 [Lentzea sp. NBRC 102530]